MDVIFYVTIIAVIAILVSLSGYFALAETSFSSLNKIRLKNLAREGDKRAQKALDMSEEFDKLLTTVLVGNNLVNIMASSLAMLLFVALLAGFSDPVITVVSTLVMMVTILIFGEVTPKCYAKANAERVAMRVAPSLAKVQTVLMPISIFFFKLQASISRRVSRPDAPTVTEEELKVIIEEIEEGGTLQKHETELIRSAIEFDDITVGEILTPRVDIQGIDISSDKYEIEYLFTSTGFSRVAVFDDTVDRIIGVINVKDFYNTYLNSKDMKLQAILRPVRFVPESTKISSLLKDLQRSKTHMAVVLDPYGGTAGIVTLEDIIEELVGEIWDESDEIEHPVVRESDDVFSVLGGANIYDAMEDMEIDFDPGEFEDHTMAGFIQYKLDRIPVRGDKVELKNAVLTVKSTKSRRIREVKVVKKAVQQGSEPE
jgi:CBS domain containing-hemolysin-like protein